MRAPQTTPDHIQIPSCERSGGSSVSGSNLKQLWLHVYPSSQVKRHPHGSQLVDDGGSAEKTEGTLKR